MFISARSRAVSVVFWILGFAAIPIWAHLDHAGWDIVFYRNAITAMQAGHDPYVDAMAAQDAFHRTLAQHPNAIPPYSYVYSPITLPILRFVGHLPSTLAYTLYWLILIGGVFSTLWVLTRAVKGTERTFIAIVLPAAVFFPGLLAHDTILSGNVAFILYALVLLGAARGWLRRQWLCFYLATILASCFKAPLLCLVVIPVLSARKQWLPAGLAVLASASLFLVQPCIWPSLFHHFLQAVELQFSYNHDFGSSPAGIFSYILVAHGVPYSPGSAIFYLLYATADIAILFYLSRQFLRRRFSLQQWIPVLLIGVILLNPRIMEYDAAPLTVPMALIGWRFFSRRLAPHLAAPAFFAFFLAANCFAVGFDITWKPIECFLLCVFFTAGCWDLLHPAVNSPDLAPPHLANHVPSYSEV